ncbi:phospholipase A2 inhibitor 25 kDa subunit-like [Rana temporaria]|uniref:phospholipase A2 inhibitor 25 kDa subunit-like n=1 Tax=Rana temporaria TaxID=8407 RepID=UPI001AAC9004|nr:phospholipase A2 inhibitor 25 kDa subunit-like [Rana temporaria]
MSSFLHIIGVLLALAASGYSLYCTQCISQSKSCVGSNVSCPSDSLCGVSYSETGYGCDTTNLYVMSCLPQDECGLSGSATFPSGVTLRMGSSCCSTSLCIPTLPSLPWYNSMPNNGLTCGSCKSADSTWCYTSNTIQCTGDENMCLLHTTKMSGMISMSTAFRGCATKSLCNLSSQSYSTEDVSAERKFICTSGSTGLRKGFILPAVICLFLLNLFI